MTTNDKHFTALLIGIVGLFATVGFEIATAQTAHAQEVVQLERVVVFGKRAAAPETVQLPRVVVTGHRAVEADDVRVAAN